MDMEKRIAEHLNSGFDQITPDVFDEIMAAVSQPDTTEMQKVQTIETVDVPNRGGMPSHDTVPSQTVGSPRRRRRWNGKRWLTVLTGAAVLGLCILFAGNLASDSYADEIYIDVNPSVAIKVNSDDQVTSIEAADEDAEQMVEEMTTDAVYPMSVESAVDIVIDELDAKGYLKEDDTDMVISYCYEDSASSDVDQQIRTAAAESLDREQFVYQCFRDSEDIETAAAENEITPGKYYYIESLSQDTQVTVEDCADKSINDIHKTAEEHADKADAETASETTVQAENTRSESETTAVQTTTAATETSAAAASESSRTKHLKTKKATKGRTATRARARARKTGTRATRVKYTKKAETKAETTTETTVTTTAAPKEVKVASTSCSSDGTIRVHFRTKITFSSDLKVIVTDSDGNVISSSVKDKRSTYVKIGTSGLESNTRYSITVAGVRADSAAKYKSVTTSVTTHTIK